MTVTHEKASGVSVLLVEDNEIDVEVTRRVIEQAGAQVVLRVARDGAEALEILAGRGEAAAPFDLVLLDLRLPTIDGPEVLRRLKNDPDLCAIPVAILTGQAGGKVMLECIALGSNMFFVKPITPADALHVIDAVEQYWALMEQLMQRPRPP